MLTITQLSLLLDGLQPYLELSIFCRKSSCVSLPSKQISVKDIKHINTTVNCMPGPESIMSFSFGLVYLAP